MGKDRWEWPGGVDYEPLTWDEFVAAKETLVRTSQEYVPNDYVMVFGGRCLDPGSMYGVIERLAWSAELMEASGPGGDGLP